MVELDRMRMRAYYERMEREGGFVSFCRMWLPEDIAGARVLDVGCRRGKGVYQISEHVGANGFVLGVDWSEPFLERARAGEAAALARGGLSASNMAFRFGWPEDLRVAEVADGSFDIAIANSVMNVAFDRQCAYAEIARALVPGGLFYYAAVVADGSPDENCNAPASTATWWPRRCRKNSSLQSCAQPASLRATSSSAWSASTAHVRRALSSWRRARCAHNAPCLGRACL